MGAAAPKPLIFTSRKENEPIAIFHCPIQIIKRSVGRSAVAAAAYRSGEKLTNEWDGKTHDYTHKPGVVHTEIMLPAHAPPEFQDRSTLWNSVEQIEKASDAQLAREIEVALPVELSRAEQLALVRSFVKDNFVAEGMCADFALHDKGDGNPHAHILLTIRPLKPDGRWGPKCRKVYDLDSQGNRIPDGKGGWKNHREDTTDWNNRENAEKWRAAWAAYANRALEAAGRSERIDHRSYERQGIDKIPSIHMGVAASQMERKGIQTEKGNINRQIAADNKLLKELKARINLVLSDIIEHGKMALQDSEAFYGRLTHRLEQRYTMDEGALKKELDALAKRNQEIDEMFMSLYADKTKGILTEQRFFRMTETLEQEQADNKVRMQAITDELRTASDTEDDVRRFIGEIREYASITELDEAILNRLIDKIIMVVSRLFRKLVCRL